MSGKGGRLVAYPLHQIAVAGDDVGMMIYDVITKPRSEHSLCQCHADRGSNTLP